MKNRAEKLLKFMRNKCRIPARIPATLAEWNRLSRGVETANASEM